MSIFEYDEERHKKFIREEGYEDGFSAGHSQGLSQGIESLILDNLEEKIPEERILEKLKKHFHLTEEDAKAYFKKYASRL